MQRLRRGQPAVISIHTPLAGSDRKTNMWYKYKVISIHTPLAGSDERIPSQWRTGRDFNPHSPCGERPQHLVSDLRFLLFQSTLPLRGATSTAPTALTTVLRFQSTLPLRGATIALSRGRNAHLFQSTLPLRGATESIEIQGEKTVFQSTLPLRGATISTSHPQSPLRFQSTLPLRGATAEMRHF